MNGAYADPVIALSPLQLATDEGVPAYLARSAQGRPLVIDFFVARCRGWPFGDLVARFGDRELPPRFVQIADIGGVTILVERHLTGLLEDARLCRRRFTRSGLAVSLARPERWPEFLETHPVHT